jgi:RNA polymerase sigma-70 factor (ECF subfamily)
VFRTIGVPRAGGRGPNENWDWAEVRSICLRLARRHAPGHDAEDIAQEAMIRAWRHRANLRDASRLVPWLSTIVRNEAARARARVRPGPIAELDTAEGMEDEELAAVAARLELGEAISHLDGAERLLLGLRYGRDLTQPAISRLLNMPEGTVKVRLHRAREKLHRALSEA